ncbi:MAG: glycerate-2-kinase family protein, partial [Solobacterium sp.]|nr:glycerate-2-kinase family protein [Solobacterium sp.]
MNMRKDANTIIAAALNAANPDTAVRKALQDLPEVKGRIFLTAIGKAAWQMSDAAAGYLGSRLDKGICITKYGHVMGTIPNVTCFEAGHPVTDDNSVQATAAAIRLAENLHADDLLVFLVSGGGSALFEAPAIPLGELQDITRQMLACGADIVEMNTIRKRLSLVKGGKFARLASPARVFAVILSDIIGDPLDMIASGPACADHTTCADALAIVRKYRLQLSEQALACLQAETPKELDNVETRITGSVR